MTTLYAEAAREKTWNLIKNIKIAFLATFDPQGQIFHARPMMTLKQDFETSTVWFFTSADSHKTEEINRNPRGLLTYADKDAQTFASLTGQATITDEKTVIDSMWNEMAKIWFPKGKDDPDIRVIRFAVDEAEFWDSPSSMVTTAYGYLKAVVTGKPPEDLGETGHADFTKNAKSNVTPLAKDVPKREADYAREAAASSEVLTCDIGGGGGKPMDYTGDKLSISHTEIAHRQADHRRT